MDSFHCDWCNEERFGEPSFLLLTEDAPLKICYPCHKQYWSLLEPLNRAQIHARMKADQERNLSENKVAPQCSA